nr:MAG TPA: hypothetical protein [Caudoviricetes sp.]
MGWVDKSSAVENSGGYNLGHEDLDWGQWGAGNGQDGNPINPQYMLNGIGKYGSIEDRGYQALWSRRNSTGGDSMKAKENNCGITYEEILRAAKLELEALRVSRLFQGKVWDDLVSMSAYRIMLEHQQDVQEGNKEKEHGEQATQQN